MRCGLLLPPVQPPPTTAMDDPFAVNGQAISTSPASMSKAELNGDKSESGNAASSRDRIELESPVVITDGMIRALVSAAENADDSMQAVCIEALMEIGKQNEPSSADMKP